MIRVKVSFKANLSKLACLSQMEVDLNNGASLDELMKVCMTKNRDVKSAIANEDIDGYRAIFVCNGRFCAPKHLLKDGDGVDIYPKVSGG